MKLVNAIAAAAALSAAPAHAAVFGVDVIGDFGSGAPFETLTISFFVDVDDPVNPSAISLFSQDSVSADPAGFAFDNSQVGADFLGGQFNLFVGPSGGTTPGTNDFQVAITGFGDLFDGGDGDVTGARNFNYSQVGQGLSLSSGASITLARTDALTEEEIAEITSTVPLPAGVVLLLTALAGLGFARRRA